MQQSVLLTTTTTTTTSHTSKPNPSTHHKSQHRGYYELVDRHATPSHAMMPRPACTPYHTGTSSHTVSNPFEWDDGWVIESRLHGREKSFHVPHDPSATTTY